MSVDVQAGVVALDAGETVRVSVECPGCESPLDLVIKKVRPDAMIGVDVWVEDRREE